MPIPVVVFQLNMLHLLLCQLLQGLLEVDALVFAAQHEANLATGVGRDDAVGLGHHQEERLAELQLLDEVQVQPLALAEDCTSVVEWLPSMVELLVLILGTT